METIDDRNSNQILETKSTVSSAATENAGPTIQVSTAEPQELGATISQYDGFNRPVRKYVRGINLISMTDAEGISF